MASEKVSVHFNFISHVINLNFHQPIHAASSSYQVRVSPTYSIFQHMQAFTLNFLAHVIPAHHQVHLSPPHHQFIYIIVV